MHRYLSSIRAQLIALAFLLTTSGSLALMSPATPGSVAGAGQVVTGAPTTRDGSVPVPGVTQPKAAPAAAQASAQAVQPTAPPVVASPNLFAYRGMGAWVDMYDFDRPNTLPPAAIVEELARRGVKTLYLQTGRWNLPYDMLNPASMAAFIDLAHAHRMKVVAWYLPGFADNEMEIRRSLTAINFTTPTGQKFDGFAPDIEDARAAGNDMGRFAAGIADYSRRLRAAVGPDYALGAIVVDAKNNKRAPGRWAGFPWPEIGQNYDVILPMAYWSVVKKDCRADSDVAAYMREVVQETKMHMGVDKPFHLIGGIADCNSPAEIASFVDISLELGVVGGSIYDFWTTHLNAGRDQIWGQLARFNGLAPTTISRD